MNDNILLYYNIYNVDINIINNIEKQTFEIGLNCDIDITKCKKQFNDLENYIFKYSKTIINIEKLIDYSKYLIISSAYYREFL